MLTIALILTLVLFASFVGVWWYRSFSLKRGILDHPNERSSHDIPTPRGGGLVMALVAIAGYVLMSLVSESPVSWGYVISAMIIVVIGLLDDLFTVWFLWRLIGQFTAASVFISISGSFGAIYLPFFGDISIPFSLSLAVTSLFIVYFLNAYNFMDGIDGIAGLQAVTAGAGWFLVGHSIGLPAAMLLGGSLAAAAFGFLILNWQPAKIFMGDAGSSFLGFSFAVLPIVAKENGAFADGKILTIGILLVWPFIFDSLITLFRRALRGEKVWAAHREHLYQRLVIGGWKHSTVTSLYGIIAIVCSVAPLLYIFGTPANIVDVIAILISAVSAIGIFGLATKFGEVN